jgi:hypothetical protein
MPRAQGYAGAVPLKTPYRDGTTHLILEPLDVMAHLAALVPRPRVKPTRYHAVFAPHGKHRALVRKAGRGKGVKRKAPDEVEEETPATRRVAMPPVDVPVTGAGVVDIQVSVFWDRPFRCATSGRSSRTCRAVPRPGARCSGSWSSCCYRLSA